MVLAIGVAFAVVANVAVAVINICYYYSGYGGVPKAKRLRRLLRLSTTSWLWALQGTTDEFQSGRRQQSAGHAMGPRKCFSFCHQLSLSWAGLSVKQLSFLHSPVPCHRSPIAFVSVTRRVLRYECAEEDTLRPGRQQSEKDQIDAGQRPISDADGMITWR